MSIARSLTWYVSQDEERSHALCLQAASPSRVRSFIIRRPNHFVIEQPYPLDAYGRTIVDGDLRRLQRQMLRNTNENAMEAASTAMKVAARIEDILQVVCRRNGIHRDEITKAGRNPMLSRARVEAAHALKDHLRLPPTEIAAILKLKHHSGVGYLLRQPRYVPPHQEV